MTILKTILYLINHKKFYFATLFVFYISFDKNIGILSFHSSYNVKKKRYYEKFILDIPIYNHSHKYSNKIFWCWFQGFDDAPELYKASFNSIKKNCKTHDIIIINQTNLNKYIRLPSYILNKFNNRKISKTHFSDIVRSELLIKYGGTWIDASVLLTEYNQSFFFQDLFFFKNVDSSLHAGSSWFITAEKNSPVLKTTRDLLYEYWRKENCLCDYFLFHIFFNTAYKRYKIEYYTIINLTNVYPHYLQKELLNKFNQTKYINILKKSSVHKLTNKKANNPIDLFINYIINEYK